MYNLFVTSRLGVWDQLYYEFDRSRFLEFTNEKIANSFEPLTERRLAKLKTKPCLFAYEGSRENVRIGYLTSLKLREKTIFIEYEFIPEIPEIPYAAIDSIAGSLDIRKWEMNRTHWAVKDEDLIKRLVAASIIENTPSFQPAKSDEPASNPESRVKLQNVTTVKGFIDKVIGDTRKEGRETFYRGHSDKKNYKLEPSLFRKDIAGNYKYLENEHILYRELIVSNSFDFSSDEYTLDRLVRMQHYSLPTRLFDITSNPLIALYFACRANSEEDGEVIIFSMRRDQVRYFDSDTASCLANLAILPKNDKDEIDFSLNKKEFNEQRAISQLLHFIKAEKPFFEPKIDPEDLHKIICVKGKKSNDRITFQSGAFLLFGLDAVLDEGGTAEIEVTRITVTNKVHILNELDQLNINESTVFPYIESSAKYVAKKYEFKNSL